MKKEDKKKIIQYLFRQKEGPQIEMEGKGQYVEGFNKGMRMERGVIIDGIIDFIDRL